MARILTVEDEANLRFSIRKALSRAGHEVAEASRLSEARQHLQQADFDLVLTDVMLETENGLDLVRDLRAEGFDGVVVVMTGHGSVETAVAAMKDGADDFIQKPLSMEELTLSVERWLDSRATRRRLSLYERLEQARDEQRELLGQSESWQRTLGLARRLASLPLPGADESHAGPALPTVLLTGETGVGKGMLARFIHASTPESQASAQQGPRAGGPPPLVHVNCSALPSTLVEGELFGHEKGAFTDAREARAGLFEMADGGTIFLDEISETTPELQAKLLVVVEQGTFRRVGGGKERRVRCRVIAASNQDLARRVEEGRFRRDLLYRLNAFTIEIPPLRERADDSVLIARALLDRLGRQYGRTGLRLSETAEAAIRRHRWPGNVRELSNAVQRAAMLAEATQIEPKDLGIPFQAQRLSGAVESSVPVPARNGNGWHGSDPAPIPVGAGAGLVFDFEKGPHTAEEVERLLIIQSLQRTRGNVTKAARLIGMQRSSLRYRIERYDLHGFVQEAAKQ